MSTTFGNWKRLAWQIEQLKRSSQCLSIIKDTAYVFGGELEPRKPRDNAVYSIALGSYGEEMMKAIHASAAPSPRVGAASTTLCSKLYFFGGRGGVSMTCLESHGSFSVFDTSSCSWSVLSPAQGAFPEDRSYHSMASDHRSTIYLHAGCPTKGRLNDLWTFDTTALTWKQLPSAPGVGRGGTSIAFSSTTGNLYRVNGFDGHVEQGGAVDVYDIEGSRWSSVTYKPDGVEGPEPRSVAALVPVKTSEGSELLVTMFGEGSPSDLGHAGAGRMFSDVWGFDVRTEKWKRVEFKDPQSAPSPRGWFDADVWTTGDPEGDRIVVHGGLHDSNQRLDDVWMLQIV